MKVKHEATVPVEDDTAGSIIAALSKVPPTAKVTYRKGRWKDQRDYEKDHFVVTWESNE